jgi:hypothetical protein
MKLRPIRYKGCEIKREHGRYYGYTPDGAFLKSSDWLVGVLNAIDARAP